MRHAPGYVDLQVNGFAGVDFNGDDLQTEDVLHVCRQLRDNGVAGVLATVITDDIPVMCRRLQNLRRAREEDVLIADVIWGLHIEGPFLNEQPGYIGAHPAEFAQRADVSIMERLLDAAGDIVHIVTLAPERDPHFEVTRLLAARGIRVSAGHCDPSLDQLRAAIDAGLSTFTHLGNGCPLVMQRHDNIIQRVLSLSDKLWIGFIADGVHIPLPALQNYLRVVGGDRAFVVTDAIQAAGCGPGTYQLGGQTVTVDDNSATWAEDRSHLIGSAATMPDVVRILREGIGFTDSQIQQLTSENPRRLLGVGD